jgi:hypothetical protein
MILPSDNGWMNVDPKSHHGGWLIMYAGLIRFANARQLQGEIALFCTVKITAF